MALKNPIIRTFHGKNRSFLLTIIALERLESELEIGVYALYDRVADHTIRLRQMREVLVCGLIGGGLPAVDAIEVVDAGLPLGTVLEHFILTKEILENALLGIPEIDGVDDLPEGELEATQHA